MTRRQVFLSIAFAILAFIFVFSAYASAQSVLLNITAAASVTAGKDESGQQKALSAALGNAVAESLKDALPANILDKNFSEFAAFLLKDPGAYVQSYEITAQGVNGGVNYALVETVIAPEQITQALKTAGLLGQTGSVAKIAVFVDANSIFEPNIMQWWRVKELPDSLQLPTNTIGNALTEQGFTFLPASPTHARAMQAIRNNAAPLDSDILVVAKAVEADAVVLGTATFTGRQDRSVMGNYHISARLELRVLETATGKIICTTVKESGSVNDNPELGGVLALMEAAQLAAQDLGVCISHSAAKPQQTAEVYSGEPQKITLTVSGQKRPLTDYTNFRRMVTNLDGVAGVNINTLSSDGMRLTLEYSGTTQMLMQHIANFNFQGFNAKMLENGPNHINYEIQSPDDVPQFVTVED